MKILITREDAAKAKAYTDICDCLLATAVKRIFKGKNVLVDPTYVTVGKAFEERRIFRIEGEDKIMRSYYRKGGHRTIKKSFRPFTVELEEVNRQA